MTSERDGEDEDVEDVDAQPLVTRRTARAAARAVLARRARTERGEAEISMAASRGGERGACEGGTASDVIPVLTDYLNVTYLSESG
jgi:hypothetical protein